MRTLLTTLHSKFIHPSLALPCLAAYCGEDCGEILIHEFTVHEPKENVLARIMACQPDVVAFSVYIWNRRETFELVDALAIVRPEIRLVLGGPEMSFEGSDLFNTLPAAALICGEGEIPLRKILYAWNRGETLQAAQGIRFAGSQQQENTTCLLDNLDDIPSPFSAGLVDMKRGFVYYETSRGCPYRCSFCMSSLDDKVRSFSMARIKADLKLLMDSQVRQIKLVDRTFNYKAARSREIFRFILEHNISSRFHFEIGAHLLDELTLDLLENVPAGMFQFEIGVQSTVPETLQNIERSVSMERLAENVKRLRKRGNIHLHLDLIAGLPGESCLQICKSLDWTAELNPHHLQLELVKLLPGAPLRNRADELKIRFDPNPPYSVLQTSLLSFEELERLRGIGRLVDLLWNSEKFKFLLQALRQEAGSFSRVFEPLQNFWTARGYFDQPLSLRNVFSGLYRYLQEAFEGKQKDILNESLARDFAHSERIVPNSAPGYFNTDLTDSEQDAVRERVRDEVNKMRGVGGKLQHFAAVFECVPGTDGRAVLLFLYLTKSGEPMQVKEVIMQLQQEAGCSSQPPAES
ncbi:MAG: DUF4080 domain-containing protein [Desulfuromonadales bacterium]|nr:DUF4080 domain-containing protein [Desulfuromonadales bacterium]